MGRTVGLGFQQSKLLEAQPKGSLSKNKVFTSGSALQAEDESKAASVDPLSNQLN
jgi:hypothetical protein